MNTFYSIMTLTLIFAAPIIVTGLGGLFSERSGVVNIALEGLMMIGAFSAATVTVILEPLTPAAPWIGLLAGAFFGALIALIHAYASVDLRADQVISGTAINLLAIGLTIYFAQIIFNQQRTDSFSRGLVKTTIPVLSEIPVVGPILFTNMYLTVYLALLIVLATWFVVYRTTFGLRLRACGEHPQAVDSMGVSVRKMRYYGVVLSGMLGGLGGAIMVLTQDTQYTIGTIHGTGFIALAALIFGKWNPWGLLGASLFFGFSQVFGIYSNDFEILQGLPQEFFYGLPYVLTIIALVVFSNKSVGPKAAGEPYDVSKR
ncbi:MAG: sugar ABC transporter permease [delta proteobacterium ML8_F1]|nr:MAG: sugar ABC transporter permease [delta proteobacterium ML8_F1]